MRNNTTDPRAWIAYDLDGTLAHSVEPFDPEKIGEPIKRILDQLLSDVARGERCKILTARVSYLQVPNDRGEIGDEAFVSRQHELISAWLIEHAGFDLEVTCVKDYLMKELYDDRAWRVEKDDGRIVGKSVYYREFKVTPVLDGDAVIFQLGPDFYDFLLPDVGTESE